jgi:hypothetical protein
MRLATREPLPNQPAVMTTPFALTDRDERIASTVSGMQCSQYGSLRR